jgi:hypothetical protein
MRKDLELGLIAWGGCAIGLSDLVAYGFGVPDMPVADDLFISLSLTPMSMLMAKDIRINRLYSAFVVPAAVTFYDMASDPGHYEAHCGLWIISGLVYLEQNDTVRYHFAMLKDGIDKLFRNPGDHNT